MSRRHVVLVGLPGAGKTTVGPLVARELGSEFSDFDFVIESRTGKTVARIFAEEGEAAFRALEASVGAELLGASPAAVLSPGGGFFLEALQRALALEKGMVVYLHTSPAVAARRLEGRPERPLLKGFERTLRLRQLLEQREEAYLQSHKRVTTDSLTPDAVATQIAELARRDGGW